MHRSLLFLFGLSLSAWLFGQQSDFSFVYRVDAFRMERLLKGETEVLNSILAQPPLGDTRQRQFTQAQLPSGHYLFVKAHGEHLHWSTFHHNQHQVFAHNDKKYLNLSVWDSLGQAVEHALIRVDNHRVRWKDQHERYRSRHLHEGLMSIYLPNDTLFYEVEPEMERAIVLRRWDYFKGSKTGYLLTSPIRWGKGIYYYARNVLRYGEWRPHNWPFERLIRRWSQPKPYQGYLASQQPKYRHGDTLRLVGYLADHRGKPIQTPALLRISNGRQRYVDVLLHPTAPGRFVYEFRLDDSLRLDQRYYVWLGHIQKNNYHNGISYTFQLEDYELDSYTFNLLTKDASFAPNEAVIIDLEAKDQNELPAAATTVKGHLLTKQVLAPYRDSVYIPDTLWQFQESFDDRTVLSLPVPDSIWPITKLQSVLQVHFQGPSGESKWLSTELSIDRPDWQPTLQLRQDSLYVGVVGRVSSENATLYSFLPQGQQTQQPVKVGTAIAFNPMAHRFRLMLDGKQTELNPNYLSPSVSYQHRWYEDTLLLAWHNPHALPVNWHVQRAGGRISSGQLRAKDTLVRIPLAQSSRQVWLRYDYPWAGQKRESATDLKSIKQQLQFNWEVPQRVYPGQEVALTITATDYRGRPAREVALAAGAHTNQFKRSAAYQSSSMQFKGRRAPFHRQTYSLSAASDYDKRPLASSFYHALALDSQLYYRLRFASGNPYTEYRDVQSQDTLAAHYGQFAPWVFLQNRSVPVALIYLDNRLWYYYAAWQATPYSLVAEAGYHKLSIRTAEREITIDSVLLKAGQRLDIGIHLDRILPENIHVKSRSAALSSSEQRHLQQSVVYWRANQGSTAKQYLYAEPSRIFVRDNQRDDHQAWGLARRNQRLHWFPNGANQDSLSFAYEPGYSFHIQKDKDRLYAYDPFALNSTPKLPLHAATPPLTQDAVFPQDIEEHKPNIAYHYDNYQQQLASSKGRLQLHLKPFPKQLTHFLLLRADTLVALLPKNFNRILLETGDYQMVAIYSVDSMATFKVRIQSDSLLSLTLDLGKYRHEPLPDTWRTFIRKRQYVKTPSYGRNGTYYWQDPSSNPYYGTGRLISGSVRDESGEPLIGASILLNGTTYGTVSDFDGYYQIWVPHTGAQLSINYTGFQTTEVAVNDHYKLDIEMEGGMLLDEVVVVGYGSLRKKQVSAITGIAAGVSTSGSLVGLSTPSEKLSIQATDLLPLPTDTLRTRFRDYAYWRPLLLTDNEGQARIKVRFPDDLTNWRHFAIGMDRRERQGVGIAQTQAYLPLQAQLFLPRFLLEQDQSSAIGVLTNRSGQSRQLTRTFTDEAGRVISQEIELENSLREVFPLPKVSAGSDSLWYTYSLQAEGYRDGERRPIPVFPGGAREVIGGMIKLPKDSLVKLNTSPAYGPLSLQIGGAHMVPLRTEVNYLRAYPYHCNEQTASRLLALLTHKHFKMGNSDSIELEIKSTIERLARQRHASGAWGWWKNSERASIWITQHVIYALDEAVAEGYSVPDRDPGLRFLLNELDNTVQEAQLELLTFLAERGQPLNYAHYLTYFDQIERKLEQEVYYQRVRQLAGLPYQLDTLDKYRRETYTGATYWGSFKPHFYYPYRHTIALSLRAYLLYRQAGRKEICDAILQYFLEDDLFGFGKRQSRQKMNTYEISLWVRYLYPDIIGDNKQRDTLQVDLHTEQGDTFHIRRFPRIQKIAPGQLTIDKRGDGPVLLAYHQEYWNPSPKPEANGFQIRTELLQNGNTKGPYSLDTPVRMLASISAEKDASYVKIELPIPAGCSYGDKIFRESRWETHREYRRDRVVIFCETLPAGRHEFSIRLEPRFPGHYTLNPPEVEMMYLPHLRARGEVKKLQINE